LLTVWGYVLYHKPILIVLYDSKYLLQLQLLKIKFLKLLTLKYLLLMSRLRGDLVWNHFEIANKNIIQSSLIHYIILYYLLLLNMIHIKQFKYKNLF